MGWSAGELEDEPSCREEDGKSCRRGHDGERRGLYSQTDAWSSSDVCRQQEQRRYADDAPDERWFDGEQSGDQPERCQHRRRDSSCVPIQLIERPRSAA
jgi:hypothetical protein